MEELRKKVREIIERRSRLLNEVDWRTEFKALVREYGPLEVARAMKAEGCSPEEIAKAISSCESEHPVVTVGGILLDEEVYPEIEKERMETILRGAFEDASEADINQAIRILYPVIVSVKAACVRNDTGQDIYPDELVTVEYVSGMWSINPCMPCCDANGISITAKPGYLLPGEREGCLAGKIDQGTPFFIGMKNALPQGKGRLYLAANDDVCGRYGKGYCDNSGEIRVKISRTFR